MLKNIVLGGLVPLAFIVVGLGVFFGIKRPQAEKKQPLGTTPAALLSVLPIAEVEEVKALTELSETLDIEVSGTVVPFRELQLAAEVAGRIIEKDPSARSGNYVTKGQVLYRIDPRDYELAVERLQRKRDQEEATLRELSQDVENSNQLLAVAEEEVKLAENEVQRFESLKSNFSSQAELDQARRSRLTAMNQRIGVLNQLRAYESSRTRLELAIKLAETELEQASLDLTRTVIRSPVSGRIVAEQVEADSFVQRGTQLVTIEDTEKVEVACNVRMDQLYWVLDQQALSAEKPQNAGQITRFQLPPTPVEIRFTAGGRESTEYQWIGKLDRYDGAGLDAQSRTVPLRVVVDKPSEFKLRGSDSENSTSLGPPMLVRGMFVDAVIKAKPATPLLLVPKLSVKPATNSYQIWMFSPDESAMLHSAQAIRERDLATEEKKAEEGESMTTANENYPKPAEWKAGFLQVLDSVEIVTPFELTVEGPNSIEYSVCEISGSRLKPGDLVVVTPLPGVEGDGQDPVRVRKQNIADAAKR